MEIKDLINKHKGTPGLVLGHGPSLKSLRPKLPQIKDSMVIFGCNDWFKFYTALPTYWVLASNMDTVGQHFYRLYDYKIPVLFADTADLDASRYLPHLPAGYCAYDERHSENKICRLGPRPCCDKIIPGRLTLQEELQKYSGCKHRFFGGYSVAEYMLAFAILMGCAPIYICGVEMDYNLGYAPYLTGELPIEVAQFAGHPWEKGWNEIVSDFKTLRDSANLVKSNIINLSPVSKLTMFAPGDTTCIKL